MLIIEGGRTCLYQWDVNQRLEVVNDDVREVHFVNAVTSPALVCEVYEEGGRRYADVPNVLLQQFWPIQAYGCCDSRVRDVETFKVIRREKPADYVYTETELKTFGSLEERIEANADAIKQFDASVERLDETAADIQNQADNLADQIRSAAPDFSASGPAPICRPLAGEPLTVLSHIDIQQEGSGDPAPDNVRPIVRHDHVEVTVTSGDGVRTVRAELDTPVIRGSFNWTTGETRNDARIRDMGTATPVETGTSSTGIRYVRLLVDGTLTQLLACNRYRVTTALPTESGFIRIIGTAIYIYDNTIDFDNPAAAYAGTEVVEPAEETVMQNEPVEVLAGRGINTIVSSTGSTEVSGKAVLDVYSRDEVDNALDLLAEAIPAPYTLPPATADTLGGVKIGEGLNVKEDGTVGVEPEGKYEIINRLYTGYEVLYEKPEDWDTNYTDYYRITNEGKRFANTKQQFSPPSYDQLFARYKGEGVSKKIEITTDTDGKTYELYDATLLIHMPIYDTTGGVLDWQFYNKNGIKLARSVITVPNMPSTHPYPLHFAARTLMIGGAHFALSFLGQQGGTVSIYGPANCAPDGHVRVEAINKISKVAYFIYDNLDIPEGTYIELWGVRANA